jgi:hypothetical protein
MMAVQITRRERAEDAGRTPVGASDYLADIGRYEVDSENPLVRHFLEGQLHPGSHPNTLGEAHAGEHPARAPREIGGSGIEF